MVRCALAKPKLRFFETYEGPFILSTEDFILYPTEYLFDNDIFYNVGDEDHPELGFRPKFVEYLEDRGRSDILDMYRRGCPMGWILRQAKFTSAEAIEIKLTFEL